MPNDDRGTRYGRDAGSGANEPKRHERKEQRTDWRPRQGGDQTRDSQTRDDRPQDGQTRNDPVRDDRLEPPIEPDEREKVR